MSALSATGVGFSWPSTKPTQPTNESKKHIWISSKTSSQIPNKKPATSLKTLKSRKKQNFRTRTLFFSQVPIFLHTLHLSSSAATLSSDPFDKIIKISKNPWLTYRLALADLDPATAKLAIGFLGPFLSAFGFLFIVRIVMSWYPKLPVEKFPYVIAYAPTEPLLVQTRKLIPPLGGVDVTPVVWFGLLSFLNEILVGPQGLLVLLSQQV